VAISVPQPEAPAGKLPPQNLEAETSVLGAILLAEQALDSVLIDTRLKAEDFYRPRHRLIFAAMRRLKEKSDPEAVDAVTVCAELARAGQLEEAGGQPYIHSLPNIVPSAGNARHYARIVKQHALLRRLLEATREVQDDVYSFSGDAHELMEQAEAKIFRIAHEDRTSELRAIEDVLHDELDKLELVSRQGISLTGTPSGFKDLDNLTGGFQPGNLIVLAARPSMCWQRGPRWESPRSSRTSPRTPPSTTTARSRCSRSRCRRRSWPSASSPRRRSSTATTCGRDG
jgi:replicative DNA helicase